MISTSRGASIALRKRAFVIASSLGQKYVARGNRTIDDLVRLARMRGDREIVILRKSRKDDGGMDIMEYIDVEDNGGWRWR